MRRCTARRWQRDCSSAFGRGSSVIGRCRRQLGNGVVAAAASAAVAVAVAQSAAAGHSATAAARWQQHGGCGGFIGTVRECADARAFERHQRANVRVFVLGRGRRDDSVDGIVVVGSDGAARGDVHRGCRCAAAANDDADDAADDIVCRAKLNLLLLFIYLPLRRL